MVNAGIAKRFNIGERARLRWDLTATNLFNTPNYTNPNTNITSAGAVSVITGAGGEQDLDAAGARAFRKYRSRPYSAE